MNGPTKLLIFGSCVSRDIFNYPYDKAQIVLVDFYCRSSIASLVAQPIEIPPAVQNISSPFQKRMAERDMTKDFLKILPGLQFDWLLLDLIDERLSLYVEPGGRACTISPALFSIGFPGKSNGGSTIHSGTEEFWRLWEASWSILADKLRGLGLLDRLLVNQVFWGSRTENGDSFEPHYQSKHIDSANQFLDRMYRRISTDIPSEQFLRFDHGLMTGSIAHRWGISPFHYVDAYYLAALQKLTLLSTSSLYAPGSAEAQLPASAPFNEGIVSIKLESKDLPRGTIDPATTTAASSLQPCPVFRSDTRWGRSVIEWPSLDAFLLTAEVHSGVHSVPIGEFAGKQINYDFLLTARPGTVLLCHFHGNTPRVGINPPIFTGLGVTSSITTSQFVPSDPALALDENLGLAWHFGCDGILLQAITVSIVKKLQTILHAPRVVAWGGSAGGFAAIRVAKDIPNSIVFAWNPQTDIAKYEPGHVMRYLRSAFPTIVADGSLPSDREQFPSLCTEEFREGYKGCILYLQERTDWHVDAHLKPFLTSFCGEAHSNVTDSSNFSGFVTDQLYLHVDHWGNGHVEPSKDVVVKVLSILSDITTDFKNLENWKCFPREVIENAASNVSQHAPAMNICGKIGSDPLGSASHNALPPELKDVLTTRMDRIVDDFRPFDVTVICSGDTVALPLFTGEIMEVSLSHGVQWDRTFAQQANSSVMWLFSLAPIGRLLSTFQQNNDYGTLKLAIVGIKSFLDYSSEPDQQSSIGKFPSADQSAAIRVRVFIKFIQVMRDRQDMDHALLSRVCGCFKYWSDWLAEAKNYHMNHHGLMGSIALLHSAVQFGTAPYASAYLDVATNRIIELGKSSFDREGLCNENSIGYHNFNLHCYRGLPEFCRHYGLSETLANFLEDLTLRATKALEFCVWQDGSIPPIGDSAVYRIKITSRNEPRCFYESGFAVVKNDDLYLSILCGAPSEIHKQVDDSSITLRFMNREILVDGGSYLYDRTNQHRRCIESSLGHSGLFLKEFDGLLRSEFLRKFGPVSGKIEHFEESADGVRVECVYSVSNGCAVFARNIFVCWPNEVAIVDSVELSEGFTFSPEIVQRFLFGPTLDVQFDGGKKLVLAADDFQCTLFQLLHCDGALYHGEDAGLVRGWCSHKYMEILPTYGVDFVPDSHTRRFSTIIKLAKCASLLECSTNVRAFAGEIDPSV